MSYFQESEYFTVIENYTPAPRTKQSTSGPSSASIQSPEDIKKSMSLVDPANIFLLNNDILNNLNKYETKYSRFLRCQDTKFAKDVDDPSCDPYGLDSYASLEKSYSNLVTSIKNVADQMPKQSNKDAVSPQDYVKSKGDITKTHSDIINLRKQLDDKLQNLYNEYDKNPESSEVQLNSAIYANTLWTILATCLLYYIFVELR
jgi:hypothetical protein